MRLVERRRAAIGLGSGTDVIGALTVTAALMLGVYAIVEPAAHATGGPTPATLAFGAALGGAARRCSWCASCGRPNPLVPMRIFRSRNVVGANLIQVAGAAGMFGIFFLGSLYLKGVLGYNAMGIGLAFLPTTLLMGALSVRYTEPLVSPVRCAAGRHHRARR